MPGDLRGPMDAFEGWLLRRVVQAVEAGEVSVDLLTELQGEFKATRERPQQESHAAAIQQIADIAGVSEAEARSAVEAIDAQPATTRDLLLRRFAEAWLEGQRKAYRTGQ